MPEKLIWSKACIILIEYNQQGLFAAQNSINVNKKIDTSVLSSSRLRKFHATSVLLKPEDLESEMELVADETEMLRQLDDKSKCIVIKIAVN